MPRKAKMSIDFSLFTSLRYDANLKQVRSQGAAHAGWNYENESPLYMMDLHRDRLLRAALHWKWDAVVDKLSGERGLRQLAQAAEDAVGRSETAPRRLRIVVSRDGHFTFQKFDVPTTGIGNLFPESLPAPGTAPCQNQPLVPPRLTVIVDDEGSCRSEFTHFKTTHRVVYDNAQARAGIGSINPAESTEVLVVNEQDGSIMEGSTTTPYFWRGARWITPPVSTGFDRHGGSGGNDGTSRRWALGRGIAVEQDIRADQLVDGEECYVSNGVRGFRAGVIRLRTTMVSAMNT